MSSKKYRDVRIHSVRHINHNNYIITLQDNFIAQHARPGQFLNIRVWESTVPLLRRPFSIYRVEDEFIEILFQIVGVGSDCLAKKRAGDVINVAGPLGNSFSQQRSSPALLVAGGVGIAPMPFLTNHLKRQGREIVTFVGARSKEYLVTNYLENLFIATDDGSAGLHGNVVDLLKEVLPKEKYSSPYIYACGPTGMLRAVQQFASEFNIPGEASLEGEMACGIGLCQGCPVETADGDKKYKLVCHDGTVFNFTSIRI